MDGGAPDISADVATLDLNVEPMTVGGELLVEVGLLGAQGLPLGASGSSSPLASSSSFQGFTESDIPAKTSAASVVPKVKGQREQKTLERSSSKKTSASSSRKSLAHHPGAEKAKTSSSLHSKGSRGKSSKEKVCAPAEPAPSSSTGARPETPAETSTSGLFDLVSFTAGVMQQVGNMVGTMMNTRFDEMLAHISTSFAQSGQLIQNISDRLTDQENRLAGLSQNPPAVLPLAGTGMPPMPDYNSLPPFAMSNPWRVAAFAPFKDGMISIPDCGTRRIEGFEFHPAGLQPPFFGYARLTEAALNREDKIHKETVIYSREQAQREWVRCLENWDCTNTKLQAFKSPFTIFATEDEAPLPFTTKIAEVTIQAAMKVEPLPQLRESDPTSPLFPAFGDLWADLPATFTVGKLKPDCAIDQFGKRLPRLPDNLIQAKFEARTRLGRTLNALVMTEVAAITYGSEPLFKLLAKAQTQTVQSDLYELVVARRNCRKHVLQEATIRHEPNKLLSSTIWGADLFPEAAVNEVQHEATRLNQSLKIRWGLPTKRKQESTPSSSKKLKKPRKFPSFQSQQQQQFVQAVPVSQPVQPSTSKGQSQPILLLTPQSQPSTSYAVSPAFNPVFESQAFQAINRFARGSRARGAFRQRGGRRATNRGKHFHGGRGARPAQ
ncbi:uncharacterized protein LOC135216296 [Macrobrachium nipponense]|uniref:uncharacterized protein LOC135216296 n=1 Tax=Macrobrachium nipponense TaxID=159736 RepID=UPI0030C7EEEF